MTDELLIRGAGAVVSGRLDRPLLDADAVLCREGAIAAVGRLDDVHPGGDVPVLDCGGATLAPGLVDPHVHPVLGDWTPRQGTVGWIESYVHGGVTTFVSAGEPHVPGRPRDPAGVKALAVLAHRSFGVVRPAGAKVHAGAVLLEPGLEEPDFAELAAAGVWLMGEIGISGVYAVDEALPMVQAARRHGFHVPVHVGGASVPGSSVIGADVVVALQPDAAVHLNGGPTAPSAADVQQIIAETNAALEVVQAGNIRALVEVVRAVVAADALDRLQLGSDTPSGTGVIPLAILRTAAYCAGLASLPPEVALAAASGETARRFRQRTGTIEVGFEADLVVLDAPRGSVAADALGALRHGDVPAVAAVVVDGRVRVGKSRVTPPSARAIALPA